MPAASAPVALVPRGRQVCSCLNVSESEIRNHLASAGGFHPEERLADLQAALRCGTQCGSCVPELKRMVRIQSPARLAA